MTIVQLVISQLDYCCSFVYELPIATSCRLQRVQNFAVKSILEISTECPSMEVKAELLRCNKTLISPFQSKTRKFFVLINHERSLFT